MHTTPLSTQGQRRYLMLNQSGHQILWRVMTAYQRMEASPEWVTWCEVDDNSRLDQLIAQRSSR